MDAFIFIGILIAYYIVGAVVNGLMHRFDPYWFGTDSMTVGLVVQMWIIIVPIYFYCLFCDRCIYWFEKKGE